MEIYELKAYAEGWKLVSQCFITAQNRQDAELQEEMLADSLLDIGYNVVGTSLERVR